VGLVRQDVPSCIYPILTKASARVRLAIFGATFVWTSSFTGAFLFCRINLENYTSGQGTERIAYHEQNTVSRSGPKTAWKR
jgi:hypothetical protein